MSTDAYDPVDPAAAELARRDEINVAAEFLLVYALVVFLLGIVGWSVHRVGAM